MDGVRLSPATDVWLYTCRWLLTIGTGVLHLGLFELMYCRRRQDGHFEDGCGERNGQKCN